MARQDKDQVTISNSDLTAEQKQQLIDLTAEFNQLETQRENINAKMNAARKAIKALGINLDAWRASRKRQKMDPEDRDEFDRSADICNRAFGVPVQADLFEE